MRARGEQVERERGKTVKKHAGQKGRSRSLHMETHVNRGWQQENAYHNVSWIVPLPQTVIQAHTEPRLPHAGREVSDQVPLGTLVNTVPVPVVVVAEVAPSLVVFGGEDNICRGCGV